MKPFLLAGSCLGLFGSVAGFAAGCSTSAKTDTAPKFAIAQSSLTRDTAPTVDMRGLFKGVLADHMAVDRTALDSTVFPNSGAVKPVMGLV